MMTVRGRVKAALAAFGLFAIAACGSEPVDPALFDAEVERLVEAGDKYGEVFGVLKERRPELYAEFRDIAVNEFSRGRNARDSSRVAALLMREKLVDEILELAKVASDDHVKEMISVTIATYEFLNEEDPSDCARNIDGLPLETVERFPQEIRTRETQLLIDLLNAPQTAANRRAASQKEVTNWMSNMSSLEPGVAQMLTLIDKKGRGKAENKQYCEGMITVYKRLSYKKGTSRGTLFRGLALMALQQRLLLRNTTEQAEA